MSSISADSRHSKSHLQFLNLISTIRSLPGFDDLDQSEKQLLDLLAMTWHADQQITVLQAMAICTDISTTTAHRRLKSLRLKGMILLVNDDIDNRVKYVVPTNRAFKYFVQIGQCMDNAKAS